MISLCLGDIGNSGMSAGGTSEITHMASFPLQFAQMFGDINNSSLSVSSDVALNKENGMTQKVVLMCVCLCEMAPLNILSHSVFTGLFNFIRCGFP